MCDLIMISKIHSEVDTKMYFDIEQKTCSIPWLVEKERIDFKSLPKRLPKFCFTVGVSFVDLWSKSSLALFLFTIHVMFVILKDKKNALFSMTEKMKAFI